MISSIFPPIKDKQTADSHIAMSGLPLFLIGFYLLITGFLLAGSFGYASLGVILSAVAGLFFLGFGFFTRRSKDGRYAGFALAAISLAVLVELGSALRLLIKKIPMLDRIPEFLPKAEFGATKITAITLFY